MAARRVYIESVFVLFYLSTVLGNPFMTSLRRVMKSNMAAVLTKCLLDDRILYKTKLQK